MGTYEHGYGAGDRVCLFVRKSPEAIVGMIAALSRASRVCTSRSPARAPGTRRPGWQTISRRRFSIIRPGAPLRLPGSDALAEPLTPSDVAEHLPAVGASFGARPDYDEGFLRGSSVRWPR